MVLNFVKRINKYEINYQQIKIFLKSTSSDFWKEQINKQINNKLINYCNYQQIKIFLRSTS